MTNRKLFVNIPVADLSRSVAFYGSLGFEFDPRFTDDTATCMLVGEDAYFMLLTRERFAEFARLPVSDAAMETQALFAVSAESREEVDDLVERAVAAGGSAVGEPVDHGFMVQRDFRDPDGHHFEIFFMDMAAAEEQFAAAQQDA